MNSFEFNKIFAALLTAGIIAMLGGFVANLLVHPEMLAEDAVPVEGVAGGGGGAAAGPTGPGPIMELLATADIAKGEKLSKACAACHDFSAGGPNKVGPNLHGILGVTIGKHAAGFAYSTAMAEHGGVWDYSALNHFLYKPKDYVPGTKMNFAGFKKDQDRADIIAWLRTQGSSMGLPSAAQIAAEKAELAPEPAAEAEEAPAAEGEAAPAEDAAPAEH